MQADLKFGTILRACRERAGLSQEELAVRVGSSRAKVGRLENDKQTVDMPTFYGWMEATGGKEVLVAWMYGVEGLKIASHFEQTGA